METNTSSSLPTLPDSGALPATTNPVSPSLINFYRITKVLERLAAHFLPSNRSDSFDFFNLCISLSRGIDYALANSEIPQKANELPILMKQMYQRKTDELSLAAVMVLMISVKNACTKGWFQKKDSEELLIIADEIGKIYCTLGNAIAEPSSCHPAILTIMERFYPNMKLGQIIVSIEAKPGFGASAVDFHITKNNVQPDKKIWLLVAQIDNIETSACLISPQQVNFLLNGKGIDTRTNYRMDPGPQMPTSVTSILKFGTNLLQAVGQFNGHYIILVAYMSVASLPAHPVLPPDYVQPPVSVDSDIIEGKSKISLKCPISRTRIKTPVKGRSCKHFQCFDFDNFIKINFKRPSWRCPHCTNHVCYTEIRLDRNMMEILEKVGDNIVEVTFEADGSWKAGSENDHDVDKIQNKAHDCEKEQTEQQESTCSPDTVSNIVDLTNNDNDLDIMGTYETADRKPIQASVPTGVQIEEDFWAGLYIANSGSGTPTSGVDLPVLADAVSPVFNQEAEGHDNTPAMNSSMHNQLLAQSNLTLMNYASSLVNEYGRSSSASRPIHRTPSAIQALPIQSQTLGPQQNSVTNLDSLITSSPSATPHGSLSNPASADPYDAMLSDAERQQLFSQSPLHVPPVSAATQNRMPTVNMSAPTHNRVPPVNTSASTHNREPSQSQNPSHRTGFLNQYKNSHLQQTLNPQARQPMQPSNAQRSHIQQGGSQAYAAGPGAATNNQQSRVMTSSHVARQGEKRGPPVQAVSRTDELFNSQPDQNWRPTSRMRGSLSGQQLNDERIILPSSHQVQSVRPQGPQPGRTTSQLDAQIANNRNAHNNPSIP